MAHQQSKKYYFHYTDREGAEGIARSGQINPSRDTTRDAAYGEGTYVTGRAPNNSTSDLMQNNYDGRASNADRSRADFYVRIPRDQVPAYKAPASGNRDVYVVPNGIDLRDVKDVKIGQRAGKRQ